ncbi:MAG: selenocysteine-specific translation elongation factor [Ilumatobacteraceae bacterium]
MTVVVGTAGHIDHGKTTLLRALTGIDADRLPEERRRGMTIDVGYAHLALPDGTQIDFVDVPGHDKLVGNMLVGAGEIDAALMVVAADDGPRAQTLEHLSLLDGLGIRHGLVAVTKADVAGGDRTREIVAATRRLLEGTSLAGSPVVAVSAVEGDGIDELRAALVELRDRAVAGAGGHGGTGGSRLAIDRVFAVKGRGVVVTGTLRGHALGGGATLRLVPGDRSARVREIQVHNTAVARADLGRTALNLVGVDAADLHRGLVLTDDPAVVASDRLLVRLGVAVPDRTRARFHIGTAAVDAVVGRSGRDALDLVDGTPVAIVRLAAKVAVAAGDRFVLRRTEGTARIVGGLVLDAEPARGISRRRQISERVGRLATAVAAGDAVAAATARTDLHGVVASRAGADPADVVAPDLLAAAESAVLDLAATAEGGAALTDARATTARVLRRGSSISRTGVEPLAAAIVDRLVRDGRLAQDGAVVRPPGAPTHAAEPDPALAAAMDRLESTLAVPAPPGLSAAARAAGCPPAGVRTLEQAGRIVVLEPDLAYAATTYGDLTARALAMARTAPLTPAALRDATGTSRRYVMAILADLDRRAILRRTPDGHVPGPRAP